MLFIKMLVQMQYITISRNLIFIWLVSTLFIFLVQLYYFLFKWLVWGLKWLVWGVNYLLYKLVFFIDVI